MKTKKRNKKSRIRGRKTCGYGSRKKHRGKGSQGGKGMAGTGKRADQKKTLILRKGVEYFGSKRKLLKKSKAMDVMNVGMIEENTGKYTKQGRLKKTAEGIELDLKDMKILGSGEINSKFIINAKAASSSAIKKIEKAGGKVVLKKDIKNK
ncbi:uL15 family ribosomal protein [Candidatus Pacearchaeota archaeon]|nr:uL15 family ribosomal protein [Candidatus Pacearchaeota archaeon]